MKLKTMLRKDDFQGRAFVDYIEGSEVDHDAACAHALMLAQDEFWKQDDLGELDARDAVEMIGVRASELMREWGFDSGEDAS